MALEQLPPLALALLVLLQHRSGLVTTPIAEAVAAAEVEYMMVSTSLLGVEVLAPVEATVLRSAVG
jgi:hypothetical protein